MWRATFPQVQNFIYKDFGVLEDSMKTTNRAIRTEIESAVKK
jgi:hypothetical protein